MVGDIDPIKAAQAGLNLADELTMHYGLLPRANRGIFAINELPDLAGKIQVGLFNILQEGDVQIKGYPIRLQLDVLLVFTANPEDYTARGKIITPLKDRIGSEIRTHYPATRHNAHRHHGAGGVDRAARRPEGRDSGLRARGRRGSRVPGAGRPQDRQAVGRQPATADYDARAGRSRTPSAGRSPTARRSSCPRVTDLYAALPSITGKFELEYEGELRGAEQVARDLIRSAVGNVFTGMFDGVDTRTVVEWFDLGGSLPLSDIDAAAEDVIAQTRGVQGLRELAERTGVAGRRVRAGGGLGHRLRARGAVRAEEDQPQRRARLHGRRRVGAPSPGAPRGTAARRRDPVPGREEEVLQLSN